MNQRIPNGEQTKRGKEQNMRLRSLQMRYNIFPHTTKGECAVRIALQIPFPRRGSHLLTGPLLF